MPAETIVLTQGGWVLIVVGLAGLGLGLGLVVGAFVVKMLRMLMRVEGMDPKGRDKP